MLCLLDHDTGARVVVQVRGVTNNSGNFAMLARKSLIGKRCGPDREKRIETITEILILRDEVAITTDIVDHVHRHPHRVEVAGGTARMREGAHGHGRWKETGINEDV